MLEFSFYHCQVLFFHILTNTKFKHVTSTYYHSCYLVLEFKFNATYFHRVKEHLVYVFVFSVPNTKYPFQCSGGFSRSLITNPSLRNFIEAREQLPLCRQAGMSFACQLVIAILTWNLVCLFGGELCHMYLKCSQCWTRDSRATMLGNLIFFIFFFFFLFFWRFIIDHPNLTPKG